MYNKKNESSILNTSVVRFPKRESNNVLKPTIISVSNLRSSDSNTLEVKRKKINIVEVKSSIQSVTYSPRKMSMPSALISPITSDSEESTFSSNDSDGRKGPYRRREHNDSERKRRDHLRNSFHNLKEVIPKLKSSEKRPPRIMILHEAASYVSSLIDDQYDLDRTYQKELKKRNALLALLKKAKKAAA